MNVVKNYLLEPVDAVDSAARIHDMSYDAVGATAELDDTWATIEADKALIRASINVQSLYFKGLNDPFNNQPIPETEKKAAVDAKIYFSLKVQYQIDDVSRFMEENYPSLAEDASHGWLRPDDQKGQVRNYLLFRDMYMEKNNDGFWVQKTEMWNEPTKDKLATPKTSAELQSNK